MKRFQFLSFGSGTGERFIGEGCAISLTLPVISSRFFLDDFVFSTIISLGFSMMKKVLWLDLETTGIDPDRHGIIQFAALVEINGELVDALEIKMQPHKGALVLLLIG